jgi:hypothetical protein
MLTHREQITRLRRLAVRALDAYPLTDPQLRFVTHGENTTFKVEASTDDGTVERFLLRVHRPGRHGRFVDADAAIRSELRWLMALRAQTDLSVPEPLLTRDGELTTTAAAAGVPQPRTCSVLRWMDGAHHGMLGLATCFQQPTVPGSREPMHDPTVPRRPRRWLGKSMPVRQFRLLTRNDRDRRSPRRAPACGWDA